MPGVRFEMENQQGLDRNWGAYSHTLEVRIGAVADARRAYAGGEEGAMLGVPAIADRPRERLRAHGRRVCRYRASLRRRRPSGPWDSTTPKPSAEVRGSARKLRGSHEGAVRAYRGDRRGRRSDRGRARIGSEGPQGSKDAGEDHGRLLDDREPRSYGALGDLLGLWRRALAQGRVPRQAPQGAHSPSVRLACRCRRTPRLQPFWRERTLPFTEEHDRVKVRRSPSPDGRFICKADRSRRFTIPPPSKPRSLPWRRKRSRSRPR